MNSQILLGLVAIVALAVVAIVAMSLNRRFRTKIDNNSLDLSTGPEENKSE